MDVFDEVLNRTMPRNADESHLIEMVESDHMPPERPLTAGEKQVLRTWVQEGLDWDEELLPTPVPVTDHWAFRPIRSPEIPAVTNHEWIRSPVDAFIARRHEQHGLVPAPEANPATLRRRMSLIMHGLPPNPESPRTLPKIEAILQDPA